MTSMDFNLLEDRDRARFINSLSGFKSANLLGTKSKQGQTNLSIISSAFHLGANPALMGFVVRPDISPRHTLNYIRETGVLTLNHVNKDIYEKAHQCSARYPEDISEFQATGLTEQYLGDFYAPFVTQSHIKISLEFVREIHIEENGTHLIICKIKDVYYPPSCLNEDFSLNLEKAQTVTVSGLNCYHDTKILEYLAYAKPK